MTKLFTTIILSFFISTLLAQKDEIELIGDRPDMTESAYIIPKGHLQFETGLDFSKDDDDYNSWTYNSTLLRYGISNKAELRLGLEYTSTVGTDYEKNGFPIYLGTKIHLVKKKDNMPQIALIVATSIELQNAGVSSIMEIIPNAILTFENEITDNIALGYNLGVEYSNIAHEMSGIISASLGIGLGEKSGAFVEGAWFPSKITKDARVNAGFTYSITNNFQFDLYGGMGLLADSPLYNVGAGIILLF